MPKDEAKDPFFSMDEEIKVEKVEIDETTPEVDNKPKFLVSTDSFSNAGLDMVFEMIKQSGFDGVDLAIRKNFDAWNVDYVKKISNKHDLPIKVIQISENINQKEMEKALDLCEATGADTITINAPTFFNLKSYNFIVDNIDAYKKNNPHIHFSIINPEDSSVFALPIPKYRFTNIVDIVKKYGCYLGLDIATLDSQILEGEFIRKLPNLLPYMAVMYFSDKNRVGDIHLLPGEGTLKLPAILKKIKQTGFNRYFSSKINISKAELADSDKVVDILVKAREYYQKYYENLELDTDND